MTDISETISEYSKYGLHLIDKTTTNALKISTNTFSEFSKFLSQKDVLDMAIGVTIGTYILTFSKNIIEILGTPIINKIIGYTKLGERYKYKIFGMEFDIGRLIELVLNLILTLFIMFIIFKYIPKMVKSNITK